jgi:hypothetical protein
VGLGAGRELAPPERPGKLLARACPAPGPERGALALAVYGLAMALHFLIVGHSLREEHGRVYDRAGHWVLAASVLAGYVAGAATPLSEVVFARLFAILAGGVVITSLKAELPGEREGRFWPFCLGAAAYAVLLILA